MRFPKQLVSGQALLTTIAIVSLVTQALALNLDFIDGGTIYSDVTVNVPSDYATIQEAFYALSNRNVSEGAYITIKIADGTYSFSTALTPPRRVGHALKIIGNSSNPSAVVFRFTGGTSGIQLAHNQSLYYLNGITLDGISKTNDTAGVKLSHNSSIDIGPAMISKQFCFGIQANGSSAATCIGMTVSNNIIGIAQNTMSTIVAVNVIATSNTNNGYYANNAGNIVAWGATSTGSTYAGFYAETGGTIQR